MSLHHFVSHISEIERYNSEGSYYGRRLVNFGGGGLNTSGICGYVHAAELYLPPGIKLLSHWHQDREAIFYCLSGEGLFLLDGIERHIGPGDGMFIPLGAVHGAVNTGDGEFRFLDCAFFTHRRSSIETGEDCFSNIDDTPSPGDGGALLKPLFRPEIYGNEKIKWWGEIRMNTGQMMENHYKDQELLFYILEGNGELNFFDRDISLRSGSIAYIIPDIPYRIGNSGKSPLRLICSRCQIGRVPVPPFFQNPTL